MRPSQKTNPIYVAISCIAFLATRKGKILSQKATLIVFAVATVANVLT
jgi:hypothetical protein